MGMIYSICIKVHPGHRRFYYSLTKKRMGKTLAALKIVAGLLLYILDVGSDIYVAVRCHQEDQTSWCAMTIVIVVVASTVIRELKIYDAARSTTRPSKS